jgi:hypothetical protein
MIVIVVVIVIVDGVCDCLIVIVKTNHFAKSTVLASQRSFALDLSKRPFECC